MLLPSDVNKKRLNVDNSLADNLIPVSMYA